MDILVEVLVVFQQRHHKPLQLYYDVEVEENYQDKHIVYLQALTNTNVNMCS
jgi:hypothetical protein